jgi:hypothetical protein
LLAAGRFVVERWCAGGDGEIEPDDELLIVPLAAAGSLDGAALEPGSVWSVAG